MQASSLDGLLVNWSVAEWSVSCWWEAAGEVPLLQCSALHTEVSTVGRLVTAVAIAMSGIRW